MNNVYATDFSVKAGTDISYFRGEVCDLRPGYTIGADISWPLFGSEHFFWSIGGYFVQKQFVLKNKTWGRESFYTDKYELFLTNFTIDTKFLQFCIKSGFTVPIGSHNKLRLSLGSALAISVLDKSSYKVQEEVVIHEDQLYQNYPDYWYIRFEPGRTPILVAAILNVEYLFKKCSIGIDYNRDFFLTGGFVDMTMGHPLDTLQLLVNYYF